MRGFAVQKVANRGVFDHWPQRSIREEQKSRFGLEARIDRPATIRFKIG